MRLGTIKKIDYDGRFAVIEDENNQEIFHRFHLDFSFKLFSRVSFEISLTPNGLEAINLDEVY